jgi:CO/xanthine dehydrogenase FAD-binding subunit
VKPAPFAYHRPRTREEVDRLLAQLGAEAKLLAGGQSLIPILNMRLAAPAHLIDINFLEDEPAEPLLRDGALAFGPLVRLRAAERSPLVAERLPLLAQALAHVAHPAIRSRGTVAGSIAHADPAAELPAVMAVLEGEAAVRGARGRRTVPARELFVGELETSLAVDEWIEEVRLPAREGGAFAEFARRHGDYALCGVAALPDALAFVGMGPVPERLELDGAAELGELIRERLSPGDDIHATARYRLWLAERLATRALEAA